MVRPQGTGRRKIDIKKIENKNYLNTTFTKRRYGLFKKAEKYCNLSGANLAILAFSSYGRPYSFGKPSPDSVINRFLNEQNSSSQLHNPTNHHRGADDNHSRHEEKENAHLDLDLRLGLGVGGGLHGHCNDTIHQERREDGFWWEESMEKLELHGLKQFKAALQELKKNVGNRIEEMRMRDAIVKNFFS